jgi:hypothetical protein
MTLVSSCIVQLKVCNEYARCMLERYKLKTKKEDNSYQPLVNNLELGLCFQIILQKCIHFLFGYKIPLLQLLRQGTLQLKRMWCTCLWNLHWKQGLIEECVLGPNDENPILAKLEYVGWVEEILEFNYRVLKLVVLFCNWVKSNYIGSSATIKWDEYGFTLVNFTSLIPISNHSFVFPLHVDQEFFF